MNKSTKEYWQCFLGGNGVITIYKDEDDGEYWVDVRAGFMCGKFSIHKDELVALRSYLKKIDSK